MRSLRFGLMLALVTAAGCGRSEPFGVAEGEGEAGAQNVGGSGAAGSAGTAGSSPGAAGGDVAGSGGTGTAGSGGGGSATGGSAGQVGTAPDGVPSLRVPRNGASTGSVFATRSLTPTFSWTPVDGATEYEIEIDDSCTAWGFTGCAFPSPERRERVSEVRYAVVEPLPVSRVAPVGMRYFWRVRACSGACGAWSGVRYVDVGRQRQDLDGDGYADTWLLRARDGLGPGTLDVFFGPPPFARRVPLQVNGPEASGKADYFGHSADAVGDVNLDGYSDLAVGAPSPSTESTSSSVYLFLGGPALTQGGLMYTGWHSPSPLGLGTSVVAVGDVDADGSSDFAAGGYVGPPQPLSLILGGTAMPWGRHEISATSSSLSLAPASAGDLDGDGHSDMLTVEADPLGSQQFAGLLGATQLNFERVNAGALQIGSAERAAIVGDTNGDGLVERALFRHSYLDSPPAIDVIFGSTDLSGERMRLDTGVMEDESVGVWPSVWNVVNAGDVNGDGLEDTAVEIRLDYSALVDVALFFGGRGAKTSADLVYRIEGSEQLYVSVGNARAVGDTNGDGFDDLVIVSNWETPARLFLGGATPDGDADQLIAP